MAIGVDVVTGVTGAVCAVTGIAVAWRSRRQDVARTRTNEIRDLMIKLVELREAFAKLPQADPILFDTLSTALNQKRGLYLAMAQSLAVRAAPTLSFHDYLTLGEECQIDANYAQALTYFTRAERLARSGGSLPQAIIRRYLAGFYSLPAPHRDLDRADALFAEAVAKTDGQPDGYMLYSTGLSYALWAAQAASLGRPWQDKLEAAKRLYAESAKSHPIGRQALLALAERERAGAFGSPAFGAEQPAFAQPSVPSSNSPSPAPVSPGATFVPVAAPPPPPQRDPGA